MRLPLGAARDATRRLAASVCLLALAALPGMAAAGEPVPGCQKEQAVTVPAPVNTDQVLREIYALTDRGEQKLVGQARPGLEREIASIFDLSTPKSKLEQFYTMLYRLSQYASHPGDDILLDTARARKLLLAAKVFSDPTFPDRIVAIRLSRRDRARPRYHVAFDAKEVRLPLNKGQGFGVFREGMCQHAKALVFYGGFSFALSMVDNRLEVGDFEGVDLWGDFGTRGLVDVDLNYVSVRSVEFLKGTPMGLVKAKVSPKEFEVNDHSWLLKVITTFVTDKSVQPIDW